MNDWAVFSDVEKRDFAFVFALVRRDDVFDVKFRVRAIVVDHQLTPETILFIYI